MSPFLAGPLRAGLAAVAGYLVAQGFIGAADVEPLIGAAMVCITIAWSVKDKLRAKKERDEALILGAVRGDLAIPGVRELPAEAPARGPNTPRADG